MTNGIEGKQTQLQAAPSLGSADTLKGLAVRGRDGDALGSISEVILDKASGCVAYVVLTSGGFLGLGQSYHPIPWSIFCYEPSEDFYVVAADKRLLDGAPSYRPDSAPVFDHAYGQRVTEYYQFTGRPVRR